MLHRKLVLATTVAGLALTASPALGQEPVPVPGGPSSFQPPTPAPPPPPPPGPQVVAPPVAPPPPAGPQQFQGPAPPDVATMVAGINSRLSGAVGYAYTITRNGQVVAEDGVGNRRRAIDGQADFTPTTRLEVMSVTKNMTAIALLKLLHQRGISVNAPIGKYLPLQWKKSKGFRRKGNNRITFRHLLTHTSGIRQVMNAAPASAGLGNGWDGLRKLVARGAYPNPASGQYKNANYALMRVLIPRLTGMIFVTEAKAYKRYLYWMNKAVFKPAGVATVRCHAPIDSVAALAYDANDPTESGVLPERQGDDAVDCGGHTGLHLSARDLARVLVHLRHTNKILPVGVRSAMFAGRLGWNEGSDNGAGRTDTANTWWHGGDGTFSGRQIHTCVMALPQGYEASLVVNSQPGGACGVLLNSYKEAAAA